ncbi:ATP-binding protein [Flavobacterium suzhouense]|uniref:histidine kinase n=1 Tax=Flavobacterium suzhouense TaxID=1529638 RepID=A0ABW5NST5_9FLAO
MKFKYNPRILAQLGTELITSDEVAFTELLKNSYDAKASQVKVHFVDSLESLNRSLLVTPVNDDVLLKLKATIGDEKVIILEDNGIGMDEKRLLEGFFTVGSDLKEKLKRAESDAGKKEKITLGDKGLGRLSSQRLASILIVETCTKEDSEVNYVEIEWAKFSKDLEEDAPVLHFKKKEDVSYTRLWFVGSVDFSTFIEDKRSLQKSLFEDDGDGGIHLQEKLQSSVSFLYSPFEKLEEDFEIKFYLNDLEIQSSFNNESINIAETIHRFKISKERNQSVVNLELEIKPWYVELIHLRILGKNLFTERKRDTHYYLSLIEKHKVRLDNSLKKRVLLIDYLRSKSNFSSSEIKLLEDIAPIEGKVYAFHREQFRLNLAVNAAKAVGAIKKNENITSIREFLNYHNGIKLYRDRFRIANLGDKESDWLNLQQARTRGQQFFRFELGNVIGFVKISDFYQKYIKEISSRQELSQSGHAIALKSFLQQIFNDDFYQLSTSAYYLVRDILTEEGQIPHNTPKELKDQVDESEAMLKETLKSLNIFQNSFSEIKDNILLDTPEKIKKVQRVITQLEGQDNSLTENINNSITTLKSAKDTLTVIEEKQKESYNNYKLMANGLITEVMTHELHSILLNTKSGINYEVHIAALKSYLLDMKQIGLYKENLKPVNERMDFLHTRISELDLFYNFLEKTFIRQGTHDDFENEIIKDLLLGFQKRLDKRLKDLKTDIVFENLQNYSWYVPKGTLTHVFYNLIDNSLYWIGERQKRGAYDQQFKSDLRDLIKIERIDENTIHYYDSGIGVIEDLQFTLFHPFKSGKKEGRGMGMYIVKNLLESFGGSIELLPDMNAYGNRHIFSITIK